MSTHQHTLFVLNPLPPMTPRERARARVTMVLGAGFAFCDRRSFKLHRLGAYDAWRHRATGVVVIFRHTFHKGYHKFVTSCPVMILARRHVTQETTNVLAIAYLNLESAEGDHVPAQATFALDVGFDGRAIIVEQSERATRRAELLRIVEALA